MSREAFILAGRRTPIGCFCGALATIPAPRLAAVCIRSLQQQTGVPSGDLDEVIIGNVVTAGIGQNPARQAAIYAELPVSVGAVTVNKVCGSGLKSVMLAEQSIRAGDADLVVAGGMENMSLAPHLLPKARTGYRLGHGELVDAMIFDGLWDIYGGKSMGSYGEQCATRYGFDRRDQDDFAVRSYQRALRASSEGAFRDEIVPVEVTDRKSTVLVTDDEEPTRFREEKLRQLAPAFDPQGTITAGNASSINDGAAAVLVASRAAAERHGLRPLARIVGAATFSQEPDWFTTAPIGSIRRLLEKIRWSVSDVDLFEINEAFAVVAMAAERDLQIPADKINVHGGAVALGHPIGCSGTRVLVTLLHALQRYGGGRGIASLCIGGGEAVAMAIERVS